MIVLMYSQNFLFLINKNVPLELGYTIPFFRMGHFIMGLLKEFVSFIYYVMLFHNTDSIFKNFKPLCTQNTKYMFILHYK